MGSSSSGVLLSEHMGQRDAGCLTRLKDFHKPVGVARGGAAGSGHYVSWINAHRIANSSNPGGQCEFMRLHQHGTGSL